VDAGSVAVPVRLSARPAPPDARFDFVSKLAHVPHKVDRALADDPVGALSVVYLDVNTDICNHACTFCDGYYRSLESASLPIDRLLRLVDEMEELGVQAVVLAGDRGEPLLHPQIDVLLARLARSPLAVGLYTNGAAPGKRAQRHLTELDWVRVSADAGTALTHAMVHNYVPGRGDFDRMLDTIGRLGRAGVDVGTSFVLDRANADEVEQAADVLLGAGARFVEYKPKYLPGYAIDEVWLHRRRHELAAACERARSRWGDRVVFNNQLDALLRGRDATSLRTERRPCVTSQLRMVVSTHGCYTCTPYRGEPERRFGDIGTRPLRDVLASVERRSLCSASCDRVCAYAGQNDFLLDLAAGRARLEEPTAPRTAQDHFV